MNKAGQLIAAFVVCAICFCTTGCGVIILGGAAATGTYKYINGQASGTYNASLDKAFKASLSACRELNIPVTEETKDEKSAKIKGKLSGDTVTISLNSISEDMTEISVRIGLWGNENSSRRIHNSIGQKL